MVTYAFLALFVAMIGYFVYFQVFQADEVANNTYNSRLDTFEEQVVRGQILASDGTVLAETIVDDDGEETRSYPYANMFAHIVGYSTRGRTGVESLANYYLLTSDAPAGEQLVNDLQDQKNQGNNVVTTLDVDLQEAAYDALGSYRGAVVVLEASTGKILAMVSKPDYNPETINEDWTTLNDDDNDESALYNRATQGLYAPGSTFKIVTLLEYIRENEDYEDFSYYCTSSITEDGYTINCYNNSAHGTETLSRAFAKSCNSAFASIGLTLDADSFMETAEGLLFNSELPYSLSYSSSSFEIEDGETSAQQMMLAIGQGDTLVSPLHMAMIACAIANDGVLMEPYVLDHVENYLGTTVKKFYPSVYGSLMTSEEAEILTEYMLEVVETGTASALSDIGIEIAGKTGTAEYSSDKTKSHAWFVGFSDTGDDDIVVCVLVEEEGSGSEYAVPIAEEIFETWYVNKTMDDLVH